MSAELAGLSLVAAAEGVRAGRFSSRELTQACLDRIDRIAPRLNCFVEVRAEAALAAATAADRALAGGETPGPLHGVPLAHKDMFYRAGLRCSCGSRIRRDFVPNHTATVLDRLDAAGALHLGTLHMSEFAFGPTGHNHHLGPCRNPWNPAHVTGGSSSGSGAAVAARLVYGALGSDTGGSVRLPAAACGLVGLKPTQTRVSRHGAMGLSFSLDNIGPLARTAADCARLLGVIAGHDPRDGTSSRQPLADYEAATRDPEIRGVRIGVPGNHYFDLATPEIRAAVDDSLGRLERLGAEIVEVTVPDHAHIGHLAHLLSTAEAATLHGAWLRERPQDYGPQVRARIEPGIACPATLYLSSLQARPGLVQRFVEEVFSACDAMLTPTLSIAVPTIAETDVGAEPGFARVLSRMTHCTAPLNYLTLPALSVPGPLVQGLPSAVQLVGRPFDEAGLLRLAAALEESSGFAARAPDAAGLDGGDDPQEGRA